MKITHVVSSIDPNDGGPSVVAPRLASAQGSIGHDVVLVTFRTPDAGERIETALAGIPGFEGVDVRAIDVPTRREQRLAKGASEVLREVVPSSDVVHAHGVWMPMVMKASRVARRAGVPYVIRPAGMLDPWCLNQKAWKKKLALALGYRSMLDHAAFIHALNADEKRLIEPLGFRCPVHVVSNGIFESEVADLPSPGEFKAAHNVGDFVLFLSRLHYKKGLDILAEAWARVETDHVLVIAGPDEGAKGELEDRLRALGIEDRVRLVGPLYGRDKFSAYVDATCFCLPSRQEGFSLAITEALATGTPCVITEGCHFPEVEEVGAGRVCPLDAEAVASALREVLADDAKRASMGTSARDLVMSRYTWPKVAARLDECYPKP